MKTLTDEDYFYIYKLASAKQINVFEENQAKVSWNWRRVYKRFKKNGKIRERVKKPNRVIDKFYVEWRELVMADANYSCVICGSVKDLHAHHKESYHANHALRLDPDNGVALCKGCHWDFHKLFGTHNNTDEQWRLYYSMKR
jgi:5-methylcytosine-specific restriction endonuclease McrA